MTGIAFPRGSAAGPSGLSPQHVLELCTVPGITLVERLTHVVRWVANGTVPEEVRRILYGATLIALEKKDGGVRPVAVGELLRRCAAKLLCGVASTLAKNLLLPTGQVAVGVKGGIEAAVHLARRFAEKCRRQSNVNLQYGILKIDLKNAFNEIHRSRIWTELEKFPILQRYFIAAYGRTTDLRWGDHIIQSADGTQQGCPLAFLLFSLALSAFGGFFFFFFF